VDDDGPVVRALPSSGLSATFSPLGRLCRKEILVRGEGLMATAKDA